MTSGGGLGCFIKELSPTISFEVTFFLHFFFVVIEFTILRAVVTLAARRANGFTASGAVDHLDFFLLLNPPKRPFFFGWVMWIACIARRAKL